MKQCPIELDCFSMVKLTNKEECHNQVFCQEISRSQLPLQPLDECRELLDYKIGRWVWEAESSDDFCPLLVNTFERAHSEVENLKKAGWTQATAIAPIITEENSRVVCANCWIGIYPSPRDEDWLEWQKAGFADAIPLSEKPKN